MSEKDPVFVEVREKFCFSLQIVGAAADMTEDTRLLGSLPELDSMAVLTIITALEDNYGFVVDDDEISADTFETLGSLVQFVKSKLD